MPVYQFHFDGIDPEPITSELPDLDSAKTEAAKTVGLMLCDAGSSAWGAKEIGVIVTDDTGLFLFEMIVAAFDAPAILQATQAACAVAPF